MAPLQSQSWSRIQSPSRIQNQNLDLPRASQGDGLAGQDGSNPPEASSKQRMPLGSMFAGHCLLTFPWQKGCWGVAVQKCMKAEYLIEGVAIA